MERRVAAAVEAKSQACAHLGLGIFWGYMGTMEKKMETTIMG